MSTNKELGIVYNTGLRCLKRKVTGYNIWKECKKIISFCSVSVSFKGTRFGIWGTVRKFSRCVWVCVCVCVRTRSRTYKHIHTHMRMCVCMWMCICLSVCLPSNHSQNLQYYHCTTHTILCIIHMTTKTFVPYNGFFCFCPWKLLSFHYLSQLLLHCCLY